MLRRTGALEFWPRFWAFSLAGWVNQEQLKVIEYLKDENRKFRAAIKSKRIRLSLEDRRRLALKGRAIGRKWLHEVATIDCADTILGWYRTLVAKKWTFPRRGRGRPRSRRAIREMILQMARENLTGGPTNTFHYSIAGDREWVAKQKEETP